MSTLKASLCAAAAVLAFALPAQADNTGASVVGSLAFGPNGASGGQYWAPADAVIGSGLEYFYEDDANIDTADFTATQLIITNTVQPGYGASGWKMTFAGFSALSFVSSDFAPGLTYGLTGNTIEINWLGSQDEDKSYTAVFNVTAGVVPEPRTYALLLAGLAGVGCAVRRRRGL